MGQNYFQALVSGLLKSGWWCSWGECCCWLSESDRPLPFSRIFIHTRFTSQFIPAPHPCTAMHEASVAHTPAAWVNLLKKMWSEVRPAWFHRSSEVLWKGKLTTVHLQNLLVPACWAAWARDNLEAARVSKKKIVETGFSRIFSSVTGLAFLWILFRSSVVMQKLKATTTTKPTQKKVRANPHRSQGRGYLLVGMMWTQLCTLCLLKLACCCYFGSCLKPWGFGDGGFPGLRLLFLFFLGAQVYSGAENLSLVWMRRREAIPNRRGQTFHCVQNAFPDLWVPLEIVAIRFFLHELVQNHFIVLFCLNLEITVWGLFSAVVWCEERENPSCWARYCLCSSLVPYLKLRL